MEIQKKQTQKMSQLLKANKKSTNAMQTFFEDKKPWKAFNLIIDMNDTLHLETEKMADGDVVSEKHFDTLYTTVAQLTSKDGKVGDPRTPEMGEFQMLMNSHAQMHSKNNIEHFKKYESNRDDKRPKNNKWL